ncbi:PTS sugar transporter subunit IIA, partial [Bacillus sp. JJ1562]
IGVFASLLIAMVLTIVFGYEGKNDLRAAKKTNKEFGLGNVKKEMIASPLTGHIVPLSKIADPLFSKEIVGKGTAIEPTKGAIISPVDGVVTTLFQSKHAIGITSNDGAEILISVGVNTVKLKGKYFTSHVEQWSQVKKGDLLIEFDIENIKAAGYDLKSPVVITNTEEYLEVKPIKTGNVESGDDTLLKLDA